MGSFGVYEIIRFRLISREFTGHRFKHVQDYFRRILRKTDEFFIRWARALRFEHLRNGKHLISSTSYCSSKGDNT